jgi:large subunit ribosomal protein L18
MFKYKTKKAQRTRRHMRLRQKVKGTAERPRFCVSFTEKHIYTQLIDDEKGHTLVASSTLNPEFKEKSSKSDMSGAEILGKIMAEKASSAGIKEVIFDRGGFKYHGRVKALADAARAGGLKF